MFAARKAFQTAVSENVFDSLVGDFKLWLDASDFDGTTWTATAGTNPTKNGTISATTIGGFPAAQFGSDGYFTVGSFTAPSHLAVFAVMYEAAGAPFIVEQNTSAVPGFYFYSNQNFPYSVLRSGYSRLTFQPTGDADWFVSGSVGLAATNFDGSAFTLKSDSTTVSTYRVTGGGGGGEIAEYATSTDATGTLHIGSRNGTSIFFNGGYLLELIISPGLSGDNFQAVVNYLLNKYSLS